MPSASRLHLSWAFSQSLSSNSNSLETLPEAALISTVVLTLLRNSTFCCLSCSCSFFRRAACSGGEKWQHEARAEAWVGRVVRFQRRSGVHWEVSGCSFTKHSLIFKPGTLLGPGAPRSLRHSFALQEISLGGAAKIGTILTSLPNLTGETN